jgi:hypothetical protein
MDIMGIRKERKPEGDHKNYISRDYNDFLAGNPLLEQVSNFRDDHDIKNVLNFQETQDFHDFQELQDLQKNHEIQDFKKLDSITDIQDIKDLHKLFRDLKLQFRRIELMEKFKDYPKLIKNNS